jgi:hypothetical protein
MVDLGGKGHLSEQSVCDKPKKAKFAHRAKNMACISHLAVEGKGGRVNQIIVSTFSFFSLKKTPTNSKIFKKFFPSIFSPNQRFFLKKNLINPGGGGKFSKSFSDKFPRQIRLFLALFVFFIFFKKKIIVVTMFACHLNNS